MITLPKNLSVDFSKVIDPQSKKSPQSLAIKDGPSFHQASIPPSCKICDTVTCMVCPKCFVTSYCSKKCWDKDKQGHTEVCGKDAPLIITTNTEDGSPQYVFQNDISTGNHILLDDVPVVLPVLPGGFTKDKDGSDKPLNCLVQICFGCHKHFYPSTGSKQNGCSSCGIMFCTKDCSAPYHSENECGIVLRACNRKFSSYLSTVQKYLELYLDICVLRVLITFLQAETNAYIAERFRKFRLLSALPRFRVISKTKQDSYDGNQYLKLIKSVDRLRISLAFGKYDRDVLQEAYKRMIAFWELYEITPGAMSRLLFLDRHFMRQSYCSPNVAVSVTFEKYKVNPSWVLYMKKEVRVERDGQVRLMFDFSPACIMPISLRMEYFKENGLSYQCHKQRNCTSCNDATDSGTHSSSIKCLKCCKGLYIESQARGKDLLLDEFPTRWSPEYVDNVDWKCNECGDERPYSLILEVNHKFYKMYLEEIRYKFGRNLLTDVCKFVDSYEKYLHSLNGVILRAKFDFVVAANEKHLHECGYNILGYPADPYCGDKEEMGFPEDRIHKMQLFPVNWSPEELKLTRFRALYAEDCVKYFECLQKRSAISMDSCMDFSFLRLEHILIKLVLSCYRFYENPETQGERFVIVGNKTGKIIQDFCKNCIIIFGTTLMNCDPRLKMAAVAKEMRMFGKIIDRNTDTEILAKLVMQRMGLKEDEFKMVEKGTGNEKHKGKGKFKQGCDSKNPEYRKSFTVP